MNKKFNTFLFLVAATLVNVIILIGIWLLFMVIFINVQPYLPLQWLLKPILVILSIVVAILGTFFTYNRIMDLIIRKVDMDKYFHPILKAKSRKG